MTKEVEKKYEIINKEEKKRVLNLEIKIKEEYVASLKSAALKSAAKHIEVKGFRKGSVPENIAEKEIGTAKLFEEQAFHAINQIVPDIIITEKINTITQPQISILKMAPGNDLEIKLEFILMPEVELADYKKIAKSIKASEENQATEKEINDYIDYVRKMRAESEKLKQKTGENKEERENAKKESETELPEFNDEFVQKLGDYKTVEEFKKDLKENISKDKAEKNRQKRRIEIIEKIISESKINLPEILIEEELKKMMMQFEQDIRNMRMDPEEYMKEIKKTPEDMKKEWRTDAEKRAKMNLILPKIAVEEKITADKDKVEKEVSHIKEHHKDVKEEDARAYFTQIFTNEKVFEFLEDQK